jgi:hypothetical protein
MLRYLAVFTIFIGFTLNLKAQNHSTENNVYNDKEVIEQSTDKHPNSKNFSHLFFGFGFALGNQTKKGSAVLYGKSHSFDIGWLYKYKFSERFNAGVDLYYNYQVFYLKQDSAKTLPNNELHNKEKLVVNQVNGDVFIRIRLKRSPMLMGKFIDFGAYGGYIFNAKMIVYDKFSSVNSYGSKDVKTIYNKLNFLEPVQYGAFARFGLGHIVFTFQYRLTALFKTAYNYADMPVYNVGLRLGLHD